MMRSGGGGGGESLTNSVDGLLAIVTDPDLLAKRLMSLKESIDAFNERAANAVAQEAKAVKAMDGMRDERDNLDAAASALQVRENAVLTLERKIADREIAAGMAHDEAKQAKADAAKAMDEVRAEHARNDAAMKVREGVLAAEKEAMRKAVADLEARKTELDQRESALTASENRVAERDNQLRKLLEG